MHLHCLPSQKHYQRREGFGGRESRIPITLKEYDNLNKNADLVKFMVKSMAFNQARIPKVTI